jgi:hypothetical protein
MWHAFLKSREFPPIIVERICIFAHGTCHYAGCSWNGLDNPVGENVRCNSWSLDIPMGHDAGVSVCTFSQDIEMYYARQLAARNPILVTRSAE